MEKKKPSKKPSSASKKPSRPPEQPSSKSSAYFINVVFSAQPTAIEAIRAKLSLDNEVLLQNYLKLSAKKAVEAVAA